MFLPDTGRLSSPLFQTRQIKTFILTDLVQIHRYFVGIRKSWSVLCRGDCLYLCNT